MVTRRHLLGSCGAMLALSACGKPSPVRAVAPVDENPRQVWTLAAPDGGFAIQLGLGRSTAGGGLAWRIVRGGEEMLRWSPLGITVAGRELFRGLVFGAATETDVPIDYPMPTGIAAQSADSAKRLLVQFTAGAGDQLAVELHAGGHGLALRYHITSLGGHATGGESVVSSEQTGYALADGARLWSQPYMYPWKFGPSYEYYYQAHGTSPVTDRQVFPLLLERKGSWLLLSESGVDGRYCASHVQPDAAGRTLICAQPLDGEGNGEGASAPTITLPFQSPWRTAATGSLADVVASPLVDDLAPPLDGRFGGTIPDWIAPARLAWDWWNDRETGGFAEQQRYVDAAAEFGWDAVLVDAGWSEWDDGNAMPAIKRLVDYAGAKGIGIHLWYNSGGPNNETGGEPRDRIHDPVRRRDEFQRIAAAGVRGIKVDFWHSDKQLHIARYLAVLADAADHRLMVNFHGCTLPRGWHRQFPNLMTMEAVRGGETYAFPAWYKFVLGDEGPSALDHVRFALIRAAVGPLDYTPLLLDASRKAHGLTYAHSLALPVLLPSPLLHCADSIEAYRAHFTRFGWMKQLIASIPLAWDETRYLAADPDSHAVVARRKGTAWYVAGINAGTGPWTFTLDPAALGASGTLTLVSDGAAPDQPQHRVGPAQTENVVLQPSGGFLAVIGPEAG